MINLLYFLSRYGGFLTFLVLEIAALYLIVRYNQTQREIWLNSSSYYSGVLLDRTARVREIATLSQVADSLARENARLYTRLYNQLALAPPDAATDSLLAAFELLPARIIKNSVNQPNNNLTLDRGALDSIAPGMGVMLPDGVLGIVQSTSPRFCRVMSVLNTRTYVSALVRRNGALGTLNWDGRDPGVLILEEVPKHVDIQMGDTVVTSGHSAIFPADIPIGVVKSYHVPSGGNSFHIEVRIFSDLARINRAYILRNRYWEEIRALEMNER